MIDKPFCRPDESMDVACKTVNEIIKKMHVPAFLRYRICDRLNRDHARTPMQWDASPTSGFSTTTDTWLKVNPIRKEEINVEVEEKDESSILHFYRDLIHIRQEVAPLHDGEFVEVPSKKSIIAFKRVTENQETLTLINLSPKQAKIPEDIPLDGYEVLISTYLGKKLPEGTLRPYEGVLLLKK